MADFRTHVTFSSAIGAGYAVVASGMGFDLSTSLVSGALCGVSGMLPDVDSDSGVPRREALGFAAAIVPMLLADRFRQAGMSHDQIVLTAGLLYVLIRFVGVELLSRWTVHRGMWHSIPAVLIFAGVAFLISEPTDLFDRYLKAFAVGLGALSHLVLDEVYSIDTRGFIPRLKKSSGTAVKLWGPVPWANASTYAKLALVGGAISMEPMVLDRLELRNPEFAARAREAAGKMHAFQDRLAQRIESVAPGVGNALHQHSQPTANLPAAQQPFQTAPQRPAPQPPVYQQPASQQPTPWFAPPGNPGGAWGPNSSQPGGVNR